MLKCLTRPLICLALMVSVGLMSGCMVTPTELCASTRPLPLDGYTEVGQTEGSTTGGVIFLFGIPIGYGTDDPAGAARDDALLETGGADALVNVAVDNRTIFIPLPFVPILIQTTKVAGTAVKFND